MVPQDSLMKLGYGAAPATPFKGSQAPGSFGMPPDPYGLNKMLAEYFREMMQNPVPGAIMRNYRSNIQTAQAARGFMGGEGPAMQEAQFATALQAQARQQIAGQAAGFAGQLQQGYQVPLAYGQFAQEQRQFEEELRAAQESSDFARSQYFEQKTILDRWLQQLMNPMPPGWFPGAVEYPLGQWKSRSFSPAWNRPAGITGFSTGSPYVWPG